MDLVKTHVQIPKITWRWGLFLAVLLLLFGWLLNTPVGILGKADAVGYAVCHQIDGRSFHLLGRQMPLCARCTGMYLGAMLGLVFQSLTARRRTALPPWRVLIILGLFVIAFGIDGVNSYLHFFPGFQGLYEPQNWLRLLTGTGMGIGVAALLFPAFNQSAWKDWDERRAISGFRSLGVLLILAVLMDLVVLTEFWPALYFFALVERGRSIGDAGHGLYDAFPDDLEKRKFCGTISPIIRIPYGRFFCCLTANRGSGSRSLLADGYLERF